jgi:hypothetical protein
MWIMIAGPYRGSSSDEAIWRANHAELNRVALAVFEKGHIPIIGVNLALPIIDVAGADRFRDIMMPLSLAAAERCDACLRTGGASGGADREVAVFERLGLTVYRSLDEIPDRSKQS